jgi:hypothetical protein
VPGPSKSFTDQVIQSSLSLGDGEVGLIVTVRKMIFSIKVFVTLLDYLKIPQVAILGDLHV